MGDLQTLPQLLDLQILPQLLEAQTLPQLLEAQILPQLLERQILPQLLQDLLLEAQTLRPLRLLVFPLQVDQRQVIRVLQWQQQPLPCGEGGEELKSSWKNLIDSRKKQNFTFDTHRL